jgi:ELWxxDGT repeat protein
MEKRLRKSLVKVPFLLLGLCVVLALSTLPALSTPVAYMVKDINNVSTDSLDGLEPNGHVNGTIYFMANDGTGNNLWKSDGTPAGTEAVTTFTGLTSGIAYMTNVEGIIFFSIQDSTNGGLWRSDGTGAGTSRVYPFTSDAPMMLTAVGSKVYFVGPGGLWVSDGTEENTKLVGSFSSIIDMAEMNGMLYFTAVGPSSYTQSLYKSNGTTAGTSLVSEIDGWNLSSLTNVNGALFFAYYNRPGGDQLWTSNGTDTTVMVKQFNKTIGDLANVNGTLFFAADNGDGMQLWKSDGTETGTVMISPSGVAGVSALTNVNGTLFFAATNSVGGVDHYQLWKSDGTESGTVMVYDFFPGTLAICGFMIGVNNTLYLNAADGFSGDELWQSDGTTAGTFLVKDIYAGPDGSNPGVPNGFVNADGTLFFPANDGVHGEELWLVIDISATVAPSVANLPPEDFKDHAKKNVILKQLNDIDQLIASGDIAGAITELQDLRQHVDGFETGSAADKNDWITEQDAQTQVRNYIDQLIAALS